MNSRRSIRADLPSLAVALAAALACLGPVVARSAEDPAGLIAECRYREALEAVEARPDDGSAPLLRGLALLGTGRYDEAEAALEAAAGSADEARRLAALAKVAEDTGRVDQALDLMGRAVAAGRDAVASVETVEGANALADLHSEYGRLAFRYGRIDLARDQYRAAIQLVSKAHMKLHELGIPHDENDPRMFAGPATVGMAQLFAAEGDDRRAERTARTIAARIHEPAALLDLLSFAASQGDDRGARALLARLKSRAEGKPQHRRELALALAEFGGDLDAAQALAESALADGPDVQARDAMAWVLHLRGEHDRAAELMAEALRVGTQDPMILYHAGMIAHARGEADEARRLLGQALAISPTFDPVAVRNARETLDAIP